MSHENYIDAKELRAMEERARFYADNFRLVAGHRELIDILRGIVEKLAQTSPAYEHATILAYIKHVAGPYWDDIKPKETK